MHYYHEDMYMYPQYAMHRKAYLGFHVLHLEQELDFDCLKVLFPALSYILPSTQTGVSDILPSAGSQVEPS